MGRKSLNLTAAEMRLRKLAQAKDRRARNRDKMSAQSKAWRERNPETVKAMRLRDKERRQKRAELGKGERDAAVALRAEQRRQAQCDREREWLMREKPRTRWGDTKHLTSEQKEQRQRGQAKAWRQRNRARNAELRRRWDAAHPDIAKARSGVKHARRTSKIVATPCVVCGDQVVEGHHPDYAKPLEVVWLCAEHHRAEHRRLDSLDLFG